MDTVTCFLVEPTPRAARYLRRYASGLGNCPEPGSYHNTLVRIEDEELTAEGRLIISDADPAARSDRRWPAHCACGYAYQEHDTWQIFKRRIYVRPDTGEIFAGLDECPAGAMYYDDWLPYVGPDGRSLNVKLPTGRTWQIDSRASNCTLPEDDKHRCWVRHGVPPRVTVDKDGLTCSAGAGSIQVPDWHGFLREGVLVPC